MGKAGRGFGIIGLGTIGEFHAQALAAMAGGYLACGYEPSREKAEQFAQKHNVKVYSDKLEEFLQHPGLEIVTVATPSGLHADSAIKAATARKHVICEKPLEVTLERCDAMIAACKKNRVKLAGIFPGRFSGAVKLIKQAVQAKRFGRLTICNALIPWHRTQAYYDSGSWRGTWALDGGGALMNQAIHTVDLLQWLAGPVKELFAYAGLLAHKRIEVEDAAVAALRFKSGALGMLLGSTAMYPGHPAEIQISGEQGSAWLRGGYLVSWHFTREEPEDAARRVEFGPRPEEQYTGGAGNPTDISFVWHQKQFENFVRALDGQEPLAVDGVEARKAVEIIMAVYQSARSGKPVRPPLKRTPRRGKFSR